jgi:hypothetical protein
MLRVCKGMGCLLLGLFVVTARADEKKDEKKILVLVPVRNEIVAKDENFKVTDKTVLTGGPVIGKVMIKKSYHPDDPPGREKEILGKGARFVHVEGKDENGKKVEFLVPEDVKLPVKLTGFTLKMPKGIVTQRDETRKEGNEEKTLSGGGSVAMLEAVVVEEKEPEKKEDK